MPYDAAPRPRLVVRSSGAGCGLCPVAGCMARDGAEASQAWAEILSPRQAVMPAATPLFTLGERLRAIYSVRGGCIKAYTIDAEGYEHIRGFYLPGELIGLDALAGGYCLATASAVVASQVCVAPLPDVKRLALHQPELGQRLVVQTSRQLALALALAGDFSAEQRVAAFLLNLRDRTGAAPELRLPMAQRDIGNYLRLATETVCRTLKIFERRGWLQQEDKLLRFTQLEELELLAEPLGLLAAEPARAA